jgi:hypothetical protein
VLVFLDLGAHGLLGAASLYLSMSENASITNTIWR